MVDDVGGGLHEAGLELVRAQPFGGVVAQVQRTSSKDARVREFFVRIRIRSPK